MAPLILPIHKCALLVSFQRTPHTLWAGQLCAHAKHLFWSVDFLQCSLMYQSFVTLTPPQNKNKQKNLVYYIICSALKCILYYSLLKFHEWEMKKICFLDFSINQKNHCVGLSFRRERMCDNFPQKQKHVYFSKTPCYPAQKNNTFMNFTFQKKHKITTMMSCTKKG